MNARSTPAFKFPAYMCVAEFDAQAQKIVATCAPGSAAARERLLDLMTRCLRRNGYGPALDRILEPTATSESSPSRNTEAEHNGESDEKSINGS